MKENANCLTCIYWKKYLELKTEGKKLQQCVTCNANEVIWGRFSHINYRNTQNETYVEVKDYLQNWLMSFDQRKNENEKN